MAIGNINPGAPAGMSQPQLENGVTQATRTNAIGGASGFDYYYNGTKYSDVNQANQAAAADRVRQQSFDSNGRAASPYSVAGNEGVGRTQPPASVGALMDSQAGAPVGGQMPGVTPPPQAPDPNAARNAQIAGDQHTLSMLPQVLSELNSSSPNAGNIAADESAARAAAFARAKEQAGQTGLASIQALQDVMANTGRMGSSQESQGVAGLIGGTAGSVNDFTREQLISDLNRAADISNRNYAGGITTRGQNLNAIPSLMALMQGTPTTGIIY